MATVNVEAMTTTPLAPPPVRRSGSGSGPGGCAGSRRYGPATTGGVQELQVTADAGDVVVTAGSGSTVDVTLTTRRSLREPELQAEQDGAVLVLRGDCLGGFGWFSRGRCRAYYEITVPAGTRLVLESGAGSLSASGMRANASLLSQAGDVEVADHNGHLALETSAGEVVASDVQADRIEARSQAGDVLILTRTVPDEITAETEAGDVDITVPDATYAVDTDTGAGSVDTSGIRTDPGAQHRIEASTSAGEHHSEHLFMSVENPGRWSDNILDDHGGGASAATRSKTNSRTRAALA